jgi:putative ABC transport system permease protein
VSPFSLASRDAIIFSSTPAARRAPYLVRADARFPDAARAALASSRFVAIESVAQRLTRNQENLSGLVLVTGVLVALLILAAATGAGTMVSLYIDARTREIGLRRALGARRGEVVGQMVTEALIMTAGGSLLGVALSYLVALLLGIPLREIHPWVVIGAVLIMFATTAFDSWLPSRRAARIPPAVAGKIS